MRRKMMKTGRNAVRSRRNIICSVLPETKTRCTAK